jgi:hypothetical protein
VVDDLGAGPAAFEPDEFAAPRFGEPDRASLAGHSTGPVDRDDAHAVTQ